MYTEGQKCVIVRPSTLKPALSALEVTAEVLGAGGKKRIVEIVRFFLFFFQAEDGIRDGTVTGVQTCALPISIRARMRDMVNQIIATNDISRYPYDSHGNMTLTISAAISALMVGDIPEADDWFQIGRASCRERV